MYCILCSEYVTKPLRAINVIFSNGFCASGRERAREKVCKTEGDRERKCARQRERERVMMGIRAASTIQTVPLLCVLGFSQSHGLAVVGVHIHLKRPHMDSIRFLNMLYPGLEAGYEKCWRLEKGRLRAGDGEAGDWVVRGWSWGGLVFGDGEVRG